MLLIFRKVADLGCNQFSHNLNTQRWQPKSDTVAETVIYRRPFAACAEFMPINSPISVQLPWKLESTFYYDVVAARIGQKTLWIPTLLKWEFSQ